MTRSWWTVGALAAVLVAVGSLVWWRSRPPAFHAPASVSALASELGHTVPASLREHDVPGASVALVQHGRVRFAAGYGLARSGSPMRPDTVMQIASVSKAVAAYTFVRLAQAGRLDLDAPVEALTGGWRFPRSGFDARGVTLRRLLSHTAGTNVDGYGGLPPDVPLPSTRASLGGASRAGEVRLVAEPGSEWRYSGGGYTVAQLAAETTTREPFARVVEREVFRPLGMSASGFGCTTAGVPSTGAARGHDAAGAPLPAFRFAEQAAAGVCSTAPDMGRFAAALMRGGVAAAMTRPAAGTDGGYGLGLHLARTRGGDGRWWHDGSNRGWRSRIEVFPDDDWAFVVLANGDNGDAVIADVMRLVLR